MKTYTVLKNCKTKKGGTGTTNTKKKGVVLTNYAGFYYVEDENGMIFTCKIRGKLKSRVITGDQVIFSPTNDTEGMIENVLSRINQLERPRIANISLALIVLAVNEPKPDLFLLDRLLWLTHYHRIRPCIVLNKSDLPPDSETLKIQRAYCEPYFQCIAVSSRTSEGIAEIKAVINREIAVMAGPSGVGKTSLLNLLLPGIEQRTQTISQKMQRGRHTTRHVELYSLPDSGWIADTPGFSQLEMPPIDRWSIADYFPDFAPYIPHCRFRDCLHHKENDCAVKVAVENGEILRERHEHYLMMVEEASIKEKKY